MAAPKKRWTLDEVHALPDDGNVYELIHGELFVSPAPAVSHGYVVGRLSGILSSYVLRHRIGIAFVTQSVFRVEEEVEVQPDIMVVPEHGEDVADWQFLPKPLLVVEVSSPSTARYDRTTKRDAYIENGVLEYWIVDRPSQSVSIVRPGQDDVTITGTITWSPAGASESLTFEIVELFSPHRQG